MPRFPKSTDYDTEEEYEAACDEYLHEEATYIDAYCEQAKFERNNP